MPNYSSVPYDEREIPGVATFTEYVDFILNGFDWPILRGMKGHIMTYQQRCDYCRLKYDFIGKLETEQEDTSMLLHKLDRTDEIDHMAVRHVTNTKSSLEMTKKYFDQLTSKQREALYLIYKFDFLAFDYDFEYFR